MWDFSERPQAATSRYGTLCHRASFDIFQACSVFKQSIFYWSCCRYWDVCSSLLYWSWLFVVVSFEQILLLMAWCCSFRRSPSTWHTSAAFSSQEAFPCSGLTPEVFFSFICTWVANSDGGGEFGSASLAPFFSFPWTPVFGFGWRQTPDWGGCLMYPMNAALLQSLLFFIPPTLMLRSCLRTYLSLFPDFSLASATGWK